MQKKLLHQINRKSVFDSGGIDGKDIFDSGGKF